MVVGFVAIGCGPPSSVRITVVAPTDATWRDQPIWRFAVTNEAQAQVWWAGLLNVAGAIGGGLFVVIGPGENGIQ